VGFDEAGWQEDLLHATEAARAAGEAARRELEASGAERTQLRVCLSRMAPTSPACPAV